MTLTYFQCKTLIGELTDFELSVMEWKGGSKIKIPHSMKKLILYAQILGPDKVLILGGENVTPIESK